MNNGTTDYSYLGMYNKLAEKQGAYARVNHVKHKDGYMRAVKVLKESIESEEDAAYRKFCKEGRRMMRLGNGNHPNIVRMYKMGLVGDKAYMEMEYVDGRTIKEYVDDNTGFVPIDEVMRFALDISDALAYCHCGICEDCMDPNEDELEQDENDGSYYATAEQWPALIDKYRVVHNDIHAGNIMRRKKGGYVLLDFGLAIEGSGTDLSVSKFQRGAIEYMAPEKFGAVTKPEATVDIYGFGVVLFKMLAGQVPFVATGDSGANVIEAHLKKAPLPNLKVLRQAAWEKAHGSGSYTPEPALDALVAIAEKCLARKPEKRYPDGKALHVDIVALDLQFKAQNSDEANKLQLLKQQYDETLQSIEQQHAEDLQRLKLQHDAELQEQEQQHAKQLQHLQQQLDYNKKLAAALRKNYGV